MRLGSRRRTKRKVRGVEVTGRLRLTSMMDILVVLLLFLLKSFVVEGEAMTPPAGLELPESSSQATPEESIHLAIMDGGVIMGTELIVTLDEIRNAEGFLIGPLAAKLQELQERSATIAALKGEDEVQRIVTVQGDKDLEFQVLQRVMYTLSQSGYEDVSLAVIKNS